MTVEVKVIGVVGGGQMGSGIALLAASHGMDVWLHDTDPNALTRSQKYVSSFVQTLVSKGQLSQAQKSRIVLGRLEEIAVGLGSIGWMDTCYVLFGSDAGTDALVRLRCTSNLEDLHSADVIIEAIVESEDVKRKLFSELDKIAKVSTILASNTSSISITRLASATNRPQQVIGMHFMNPPPIMRLVEIIRGADTSDATFSTIKSLAERFGKTVICSRDYPGFIVNRILMPMINEAFYTLYTGVASKEDIDTGMKLGTKHPMGPLELADFIGLDVCLSILKILHSGLGDGRYAPCPLLVQYVDAGRLGKKRGIGVYNYDKAPKETSMSARL